MVDPTDQHDEEERDDLYVHHSFRAEKGQNPLRVDKFLFNFLEDTSRSRIQKAADAGAIHVNGQPVKSNYKVKPGDEDEEVKETSKDSIANLLNTVEFTPPKPEEEQEIHTKENSTSDEKQNEKRWRKEQWKTHQQSPN